MDLLTDAGASIASDVAPSLLTKMKKHIDYIIKYKDNLKNLEAAKDQLDAKRIDASRFLSDTNSQLKDVSSTITLWRTQADELDRKAQCIISRNKVSCLNPCSRYSMSKHAWELTQEINHKVEKAPDFGTKFDRPTPELGATFNLKGFMEFESRLRVLNEVMKVIKDEEVSMCSICGMGGMGKTTLAKKLIQRVEADRLFNKVAMATVSQIPNLEKIQQEIIEQLGLKIDEGTARARAKKLNAWLANNNVLLILDDVWWQLNPDDFENVGIPLESEKCKIVITSRNEDECKKMGSQRNFLLGVLERKEAWDLFRLSAGKCVEDLNLEDTARKIANECDGLPIAIVTIASALKDKPISIWNDSLRHLRNSNLQRISGMDKVYSRIRLSYDLLNDEEAQSCFRLCCLFPEDRDVSADDLVFCGKGLDLFENVDCIDEARDRVEAIIDKLKKSFLLLDGETKGCVRMHDIMRDFAISISCDSNLVRHGKEAVMWPKTFDYENCTAISFTFDEVKEQPVELTCPNLKLLRLCFQAGSAWPPLGFFDRMKELRVLILRVPSILQPLNTPKELRTLIVIELGDQSEGRNPLDIGDLIGNGDLKHLEILTISSARPCNDFPVEIGLLCNLRYLDFSSVQFKYMPPGVMSRLVKLEELMLPPTFASWGCRERVWSLFSPFHKKKLNAESGVRNEERVNASLGEIESLPLTRLETRMNEGSSLGEEFVKKLKRFTIFIGGTSILYSFLTNHNAALGISGVDASRVTMKWIVSLLTRSEQLLLRSVKNLNDLMFLPRSLQLKKIVVGACDEIECFVSTIVQQAPCFTNLCYMKISLCCELKYVFPLSVARELSQLQEFVIASCDKLEAVFFRDYGNQTVGENISRDDEANGAEIILPQLKTVVLLFNSQLRVFYSGNETIELLSLEEITFQSCRNMEAFAYGSLKAPKLKQVYVRDGIEHYNKDGMKDLHAFFKEPEFYWDFWTEC